MGSLIQIVQGDALEILRDIDADIFDALVVDPPAGIGFMDKSWDGAKGGRDKWIAWLSEIMAEALRVLKPGAHGLVWALPRTSHWTGMALELAGFEIRDSISHIFGSGFPKSLNVSKAIDKAAGAERKVVGPLASPATRLMGGNPGADSWRDNPESRPAVETTPATPAAVQWQGWGTALKPAAETWWLVRKPLIGTVASNVMAYGTGALNVDGCRVASSEALVRPAVPRNAASAFSSGLGAGTQDEPSGRWPPNLLLIHNATCEPAACTEGCPVAVMDAQSEGGASRFFPRFRYCAKASRKDREAGLGAPDGERANTHPTVKSRELMRWLVRLITPPGGVVLDCFAGSGSTGVACALEGFDHLGIEISAEYVEIANKRVASV